MSTKEQKHSGDKAGSKRQAAKPSAENQELMGGVLKFQRLIGNQAVTQLLSEESSRRLVQAKLALGPANNLGAYQPGSQEGRELIAPKLTPGLPQPGVGPRKQSHSEQTEPISQESPSPGVFWGSTRSVRHVSNADHARASLWGGGQKANPANLFARKTPNAVGPSSSNTSNIQRYETSAGFFDNKVTFESSAVGATLAKALDIQQDGTGITISSQDYDAVGTVKASGPKERVKEFEVGFLQTVYDSRRSFFYEPDPYTPGVLQQIGTAIAPGIFGDRLKITDLCDPLPVRDGDTGVVPWYGTETVKAFDEAPDSTKTASMYDKPGTTHMDWTKTVGGKTQNLVKTRGQDVFRSWVSVQEKGTTGFFGMHRLGYIDWKVDYGTDITYNKANPGASVVTPTADSGGKVIGINEGPGIKLPFMDDPTANDAAKDEESTW